MHRLDLLFIINPQNLIQIRTILETVNVKFINSYFIFFIFCIYILSFSHIDFYIIVPRAISNEAVTVNKNLHVCVHTRTKHKPRVYM